MSENDMDCGLGDAEYDPPIYNFMVDTDGRNWQAVNGEWVELPTPTPENVDSPAGSDRTVRGGA